MGRSIKVGDRFVWNRELDEGYVLEVEWSGKSYVVVKKGTSSTIPLGSIYINGQDSLNTGNWDYIGNFSKQSNFNELYDLLNS